MNIIKINILKNKMVECEKITAGVMGENGETTLKFIVPEEYKNYYKYLDIIKADGEKTQTVVDTEKKDVFYFTLPYFLTEGSEICIQLVMKLENKIFKSNPFSLSFNGSIDAIQILEDCYQDTIEFLMESKTDIKETALLDKKIEARVENSEFYSFKEKTNASLDGKVDKAKGKDLSDNNYTTEEKEKLSLLPSNAKLTETLDKKISEVAINVYTTDSYYKVKPVYETNYLDNYKKSGVYYIRLNYISEEDKCGVRSFEYRLHIVEDYGFSMPRYALLMDCEDGSVRKNNYDFDHWSGWYVVDNQFTSEEKEKLFDLPTNEMLQDKLRELKDDIKSGDDFLATRMEDAKNESKEYIDNKIALLPTDVSEIKDSASNALKNTVLGTNLTINDISPLTHRMKISVMGKNRINNNWEIGWINTTTGANQSSGSTTKRTKGYTTVIGGETYCFSSPDGELIDTVSAYYYDENKSFLSRAVLNVNKTTKAPKKAKFLRISGNAQLDVMMQYERGSAVTDFENYIEPSGVVVTVDGVSYTPDSEGLLAVQSSYPAVEISSDNAKVEINCEYNKDLNKAFAELINAIASLGGNV